MTVVWGSRYVLWVRLCVMLMGSVCARQTMICKLSRDKTDIHKGKLFRLYCGICMPSGICLRRLYCVLFLIQLSALGMDSDFRAFALTLLHVAMLQGDYSCAIISEFHERGMLHDLHCDSFQPNPSLTASLPSDGEANVKRSGCAIVGAHGTAKMLWWVILLLPMLAVPLYTRDSLKRDTHAPEPDSSNLQ